jgi:hypothetical protein
MTLDIDRLEDLAKAATPGPWRWADWSAPFGTDEQPDRMLVLGRNLTQGDSAVPYIRQRTDGAHLVLRVDERPEGAVARYIAALSPDVVLELIRLARAAAT